MNALLVVSHLIVRKDKNSPVLSHRESIKNHWRVPALRSAEMKSRQRLPVVFHMEKLVQIYLCPSQIPNPVPVVCLWLMDGLLFCHKVSWSLLTCHWNWNDVKLFIGKLQDLEPFNSHNPMTKENQPRMAGGLPNRSQCYVFIMTPWEQKGKDDLHSRITIGHHKANGASCIKGGHGTVMRPTTAKLQLMVSTEQFGSQGKEKEAVDQTSMRQRRVAGQHTNGDLHSKSRRNGLCPQTDPAQQHLTFIRVLRKRF